jgi:hypothetical protein
MVSTYSVYAGTNKEVNNTSIGRGIWSEVNYDNAIALQKLIAAYSRGVRSESLTNLIWSSILISQ